MTQIPNPEPSQNNFAKYDQTQPDFAKLTSSKVVAYLRSLTVGRSTRSYIKWINDTIGWYTLFWVALIWGGFLVSGLQILKPLPKPLLLPKLQLYLTLIGAAFLLLRLLTTRISPIPLRSQDVFRLGMAPLAGSDILGWPLGLARVKAVGIALLPAILWMLFCYVFLGTLPWGTLLLAPILGWVWLESGWLSYASRDIHQPKAKVFSRALTLFVLVFSVTGMFSPVGLWNVLWDQSLLAYIAPIALLILSHFATRSSLHDGLPSTFLWQARVLSQLQSTVYMSAITRAVPNQDERRRLKAQLEPDRQRSKPTVFLPPPPASWGVQGALLWRSALMFYRRPFLEHLPILVSCLALLLLENNPIATTIFGISLQAVIIGLIVSRLVAPAPLSPLLPILSSELTIGRVLPGLILLGIFFVALGALLSLTLGLEGLAWVKAALPMLCAVVFLEKMASWGKTNPYAREVALGAAVVAILPDMIAHYSGYGQWGLIVEAAVALMMFLPTGIREP